MRSCVGTVCAAIVIIARREVHCALLMNLVARRLRGRYHPANWGVLWPCSQGVGMVPSLGWLVIPCLQMRMSASFSCLVVHASKNSPRRAAGEVWQRSMVPVVVCKVEML